MRKRRRKALPSSEHRVLLSEVLPFELPPSFDNSRIYSTLVRMGLKRDVAGRYWTRRVDWASRLALTVMFGEVVCFDMSEKDSSGRVLVSLKQSDKRYAQTAPFKFSIRHRETSRRELSVAHPRSQLDVVDFYNSYGDVLLHHAGRGGFSLRRPAAKAKIGLFKDWLFVTDRGDYPDIRDAEVHGASDEIVRSYFTYQRYTNIHQFYDSEEYRFCERKYGYLIKADITKCFDSIYTHSIAWATNGRELVKANLRSGTDRTSFGAAFDSLLQAQNRDETSGILIGSEYARIFAEIILQRVDVNVETALSELDLFKGRDYDILRYVDDYFVFLANRDREREIVDIVEGELRAYKLHLNPAKREAAETPWLSPLSVAKERLRVLIDIAIDAEPHRLSGPWMIDAADLVAGYKRVLIDTDAAPPDLANYALSRIERSLERLIASAPHFIGGSESEDAFSTWERESSVDSALLALVEFAFFVYGGVRRASPGVKLGRIVTSVAAFYRMEKMPFDRRHAAEVFLSRELRMQLERFSGPDRGGVEQVMLLECLTYVTPLEPVQYDNLIRLLGKNGSVNFSLVNAVALVRHVSGHPGYELLLEEFEQWILGLCHGPSADAEVALAALAFVDCPFISTDVRRELVARHAVEVDDRGLAALEESAGLLVSWREFDLYGALQSKRMFEVY